MTTNSKKKIEVTPADRRHAASLCGPSLALEHLGMAMAIFRMHNCGHPDLKREKILAIDPNYHWEPVKTVRLYCEACGFDSSMAHQYPAGDMRAPTVDKLRRYNSYCPDGERFAGIKKLIELCEKDKT